MPNRSSNRGRGHKDANQIAYQIVQEATSEETKPEPKSRAAVTLGRLGGLKGGRARAEKLTAEQRIEIAKRAADARWSKEA